MGIGNQAFMYDDITSVTIPGSVQSIGSAAFMWNYNLESVVIGSGVEHIAEYAFYQTRISSLSLPDSIETIGSNAFA